MEAVEEIKITTPVHSQYFPTVKIPNMCTLVALAMALDGSGIPRPELNDMVDDAVRLGITSPQVGGISAAGCVRLAMEYAVPEFGALGVEPSTEEAKSFLKNLLLEKKRPVVVMSTVQLSPTGSGHAQCITGIDKDDNISINDSFCSIKKRRDDKTPDEPLGSPKWCSEASSFVATWKDGWNTRDNYIPVPDKEWDPEGKIADQFKDKEWRRFWCIFHPK